MRTDHRLGICLLLACAIGAATALSAAPQARPGQSQAGQTRPGTIQAPARDTPPPPATGTAAISGRVVSNDGKPVRKATVRISGRTLPQSRTVSTDAEGRYEALTLPAGAFLVVASKNGYVGAPYGAGDRGTAPKMVDVGDAARVAKIDIVLSRGCVITGRIFDEFAEPVQDVSVMVLREQSVAGRRRPMMAGGGRGTDDLGQYRLFGLTPGDYYVSATARPDSYGPPGTGETDRAGYAPTYYPGSAVLAEAQRVTCQSGQETANIDFGLIPIHTAQVSGRVVDSAGRPAAGAYVGLRASFGGIPMAGGGSSVRPDGTFVVTNVAPGDYYLTANSTSSAPPGTVAPEREFAQQAMTVSGADVSGVVVQMVKGARVTGRIVPDAGLAFDFPPSRSAAYALPVEPDVPGGGGSGDGKVQDDGSFELKGLFGPRVFRVLGAPNWRLKEVRIGGRDSTDQPMDFKGTEELTGIQIVLTNRLNLVTGTVQDEHGVPTKDAMVIVFAEDTARWRYPSRFVALGRPSPESGQFRVSALPAGTYLAVAVPSSPTLDHQDAETLERLRRYGTRVVLDEGGTQNLTLKITKEPVGGDR